MGLSKRIVCAALSAAMLLPSALGACDSGVFAEVFPNASLTASADSSAVSVGKAAFDTSYTAKADSVTLSWKKVNGAYGYRIYRYNSKSGTYEKVKTITNNTTFKWKNTGLAANTQYRYKVKAYKKVNGNTYWGKASSVKYVCTVPSAAPQIKSQTMLSSGVKLTWSRVACDGYQIYCYNAWTGKWEKCVETKNQSTTSATLNPNSYGVGGINGYQFKIRAYKTDGAGVKKTTSNTYGDALYNINDIKNYFGSGISRLSASPLTSRVTYTMYNTQGKKTIESKQNITPADRLAIERFAKKYFKSSWTPAQKAAFTLNWINKNVEYASDPADYYSISGKGYAEAIFDFKMGQCLQYNGAMVEMLNYLGYDASLIMGFRGSSTENRWQHFWGEVKIGKNTYVMETGNYGQDGNWMYFGAPYSEAGNYIKNNKVVTK